ncbi:DedA family protein [Subtercola sp. Z020]|nr:DedA family protein [Subtercola sp. Z020]
MRGVSRGLAVDQWLENIPPIAVLLVVLAFVAVESLGVPLPGETILVAGTLVSLGGSLPPWLVAVAAVIGAVLGDSIGYVIGHRFGARLLIVASRRFPNHFSAERIRDAIALMNRWGALAVFGGRFVAFLRVLVGPLAGTLRMPYRRFLVANVAGAIVWAGGVTLIVTLLGRAAEQLIHQFTWLALLAVLVAIVVVATVVVYRGRRAAALATATATATAQAQAQAPAAPTSSRQMAASPPSPPQPDCPRRQRAHPPPPASRASPESPQPSAPCSPPSAAPFGARPSPHPSSASFSSPRSPPAPCGTRSCAAPGTPESPTACPPSSTASGGPSSPAPSSRNCPSTTP